MISIRLRQGAHITVILLTPYSNPVIGGITTFVYNLRDFLSRKGSSVTVITGQGKEVDDKNGYIKSLGPGKISYILKAFMMIRRKKPEVLHSQAHWYVLAPCAVYKRFHPDTTLIHTFHTEPVESMRGLRKRIFEKHLARCDHVTFVSRDLMNKMEMMFDIRSNKKVIHSGVSIESSSEDEIEDFIRTYDLRGAYPVLTFIGPLSWKMKVEGVKRLIEAFSAVREGYPEARLVIVGDGKYKVDHEKLVEEKDLKASVVFTGFLQKTSTPLAVTDIYTHISLQEGLPFALLEAMGTGKPVVASNTGGIPEVVENGRTGIVVDSVPEKIAVQITELLGERDRMDRLGETARGFVEENHKWLRVADEYLLLYKRGV